MEQNLSEISGSLVIDISKQARGFLWIFKDGIVIPRQLFDYEGVIDFLKYQRYSLIAKECGRG